MKDPTPHEETPKKVLISVRVNESILNALDQAVALGYFRSRTEAINIAIERLLHDIFFIAQVVKLISRKKESIYSLNDIFSYLSQTTSVGKIFDDFSVYVPVTLRIANHKRGAFEEFYKTLEQVFDHHPELVSNENNIDGGTDMKDPTPHEDPSQNNSNSKEGSP